MSDDKNIMKDDLPPAAKRALEEAAERRAGQEAKEAELEALRSNESGGPKAERVRYGDWEKAGRAVDF